MTGRCIPGLVEGMPAMIASPNCKGLACSTLVLALFSFRSVTAAGETAKPGDPVSRTRRVLYNFDGDSCLSTRAGSKGPVAVTVDDVKRLIDEVAYEGSNVIRAQSGEDLFITPKPTKLVQRMLQIATAPNESDIVIDFFAGSASTGHAVYKQNMEDGGDRRFILVQLPEPLPSPSNGVNTIFDMGVLRLKNAGDDIAAGESGKLDGLSAEDLRRRLGCRVFKLTSSNFKIWNSKEATAGGDGLAQQLKLFADHVLAERPEQDILYELTLKVGLALTAKVETKTVASQTVYSVADGLLVICLTNPVTQGCLRALSDLAPQRVICLDAAFQGNDQLKTNTVLEMKSRGIEFRTV